ncbi:hypothetical protein D0869_12168 [Hortaea werneckii]|nr:MFS general substrate transporter [Hortaea werneckii]KAI7174947.1 MFS general substrate transporter [Hortaea werneckii]KAI7673802.1 MFS general substrate transporter [Hortaea werneckii]RMX74867.1 hypothetical protein D0869_12168 [Hortaea werneckii]RMX96389.1 hypothetical protein D0868_11205 [Hortaea werneckii]
MPPSRTHSRPASHRSANGDGNGSPQIGKLEYQPGGRPLLAPDTPRASHQSSPRASSEQSRSYAGSFFSDVAEGIATQQRSRINRQVLRYLSFAWAIINCLGAGSITAYSLYAPLFQRRLHYTQLQVNGVSITAELAMYLPVPLFGFLCDRFGPGVPSLLAGVLFGLGYVLAAFTYASGPPPSAGGDGRPYWSMILAFIPIGCGTSCMYLSAVTTCAKNFGRGKYKGLALALPIACFGLSGMWESQVGSQLLYERLPGGGKGEVDVYRFFLFLGCFLLAAGAVGFFALRIVGEEELIDEAVEELEASGLLEDSAFFQPSNRDVTSRHAGVDQLAYGTLPTGDRRLSAEEVDKLHQKAAEHRAYLAEQDRKKAWLLNEETRRFLTDKTMWWLAAGFFLVTGPGEAFINNLGTIIGTLYPPPTSLSDESQPKMTTAATHVSIVAITSTIARILTGTLTDILAPTAPHHQHRRGPNSLQNSTTSLSHPSDPAPLPTTTSDGFHLSRITFLITFSLLMSLGQLLLATGLLQNHGNLFWLVSASIGAGYGAVFSLTPIIVSVVWGVENFGTNWGIVATAPAIGATVWGLVYSAVYQGAANHATGTTGFPGSAGSQQEMQVQPQVLAEERLCYGAMCYAPTFWAMAASVWVACGLWMYAWRGPGGWLRRGIAV